MNHLTQTSVEGDTEIAMKIDIFNKKNRLETMSGRERFLIGKETEEKIVQSLQSQGVIINESNIEKIDKIIVRDDKQLNCVIKTRMSYSGNDILLEIIKPYYTLGSKDNQWGRDYIGKYDLYICLAEGKIRVIEADAQKRIVSEMLHEWQENKVELQKFNSKKYEGCQVVKTKDKYNGVTKILFFINPKVYKEGSEINYYKF